MEKKVLCIVYMLSTVSCIDAASYAQLRKKQSADAKNKAATHSSNSVNSPAPGSSKQIQHPQNYMDGVKSLCDAYARQEDAEIAAAIAASYANGLPSESPTLQKGTVSDSSNSTSKIPHVQSQQFNQLTTYRRARLLNARYTESQIAAALEEPLDEFSTLEEARLLYGGNQIDNDI